MIESRPTMPDPISADEIRNRFVRFFEERGHLQVPSSSLVPHNDPTVLLTTAGMQQMTPYFLGLERPPAIRMCSVQKCFRTVDIDEVGDESHCTFFFMLGNFSVGDYFKTESLTWSWEFLTGTMGIPGELLYPTVHPDDNDAYAIWRDRIGIPEERIGKLADNWWGPVGPTGPNGPDSEIYFDRGIEHSCGRPECAPGCDCERYLEVWNNVFMEFFQQDDGSRNPLTRQSVDTGMGLERLVMVMQGVESLYDTDLYQPIIRRAGELAGVAYGDDVKTDRALRVIADHARGSTFLIADGVLPGNEGRAYVLRRILRRAVRHGRILGLEQPFLAEMATVVIEQFGRHYPQLVDRQAQIQRVITHEEESFSRTLAAGLNRFQVLVEDIAGRAGAAAHGREGEVVATLLPGDEVFRLYDTYGFPIDLTIELAREHGLSVDQTGLDTAFAAQRETSRGGAANAFKDASRSRAELYVSIGGGGTAFVGYDDEVAESRIVALIGPDGPIDEVDAGQPVEILLDRTPFYGESGGQVGDTGWMRSDTGLINIEETVKPTPELIVHHGIVAEGFIRVGEAVTSEIDAGRRQSIRRNHTATHLLHRALRIVLGEETHQAGSLVAPDRLRFDFTSLDTVTAGQLRRVVEIINHEILAARPVSTETKPYTDAVSGGAMALFGEKYGEVVRIVQIPEFSQELCGGTHVAHTGEIGPFLVVSEGSVAAGVRRVEAITGAEAVERMLDLQRIAEDTAHELRVPWTDLPAQVMSIQARARNQDREMERLRGQIAGSSVGDLLHQAMAIDGTRVVAARVDAATKDILRHMGDRLRDQLDSGVIVLGSVIDGRPNLLSMVTPDIVQRGIRAGDVVRETASIIDGRGGGRPELAEAGGKDISKLDDALAAVLDIVRRGLSK